MKPSFVVSLLLFSLLIFHAQGIRLEKRFKSIWHHKIHEKQISSLVKTSINGGIGEVSLCKEGHCKGKSGKLTTTTSPLLDNERISGKEENFPVNPASISEHREISHEHYTDLMDIAEMDYSPAKRKPPIHN